MKFGHNQCQLFLQLQHHLIGNALFEGKQWNALRAFSAEISILDIITYEINLYILPNSDWSIRSPPFQGATLWTRYNESITYVGPVMISLILY